MQSTTARRDALEVGHEPPPALAPQEAPLVAAVRMVGDSWMLLILWAARRGVTRFDSFQRELGVARNILSDRLRRLLEVELLEKAPIADGARRMEYRLTPKGDALGPALDALASWGRAWGAGWPADIGDEWVEPWSDTASRRARAASGLRIGE